MDNLANLLLEAVLEISHDNILVADRQGQVLRASPNCLRSYGIAPEQMPGCSVHELEASKILSPSVTARVLREKIQRTVLQTTLTGRQVIATSIPVLDERGELCCVVSASYDLSDIEVLRREYEYLSEKMLSRFASTAQAPTLALVLDDLIFQDAAMRELAELILRIAKTDVTVLLLGPSGVGKTALARLLHRRSRRAGSHFIEVNCGAMPDSLFESEMFGYVTGVFTGARREKKLVLLSMPTVEPFFR